MTASANILWTNAYAQGGGSIQSNVNAAFPPMIAAINVGLLQRTGDLTNVLSSGCSTGNCSFSEVGNASYSTVAISHSCEDSTDSIHVLNQTRINNSTVETYLGLDYGDNNTFTWSNESSSGIGPLIMDGLVLNFMADIHPFPVEPLHIRLEGLQLFALSDCQHLRSSYPRCQIGRDTD